MIIIKRKNAADELPQETRSIKLGMITVSDFIHEMLKLQKHESFASDC